MRILIIGSGGREHALALKLAHSLSVEKVFVAPGNGGTAMVAENINIAVDSIPELVEFAKRNKIDLVVPGPELPLTLGITDAMQEAGIVCFGPDRYCARLEGSKSFAKEIMADAGVPTAACKVFTNLDEALAYIDSLAVPPVIKADGLAAGKGVIVASSHAQAKEAVEDMLKNARFGDAGSTVVVEEKLNGEEVSLLCICDGQTAVPLPSAQDHKAVYDNDTGPNTGGMGAYSPAPCLPDSELESMADIAIRPILTELARRGHPFKGILYAGLMLTSDGPKVLEYNVRFGDPECQPLLLRMKSDLASHLLNAANGNLKNETIAYTPDAALGVVIAAPGYPDAYKKNLPIEGLEAAEKEAIVFHGGTVNKDGKMFSAGGRILCVTALGQSLAEARDRAYRAVEEIHIPQSHYRRDIGAKGLNRKK